MNEESEVQVGVTYLRNYKGFKKFYVTWAVLGGRGINTRYEVGRRLIALYRLAHGSETSQDRTHALIVPVQLKDLRKLYNTRHDGITIDRWKEQQIWLINRKA